MSYTFRTKDSVDLNTILLPSQSQIIASTYPNHVSVQFGHTLLPSKVRPAQACSPAGPMTASASSPSRPGSF
jgi:hypothetical protein